MVFCVCYCPPLTVKFVTDCDSGPGGLLVDECTDLGKSVSSTTPTACSSCSRSSHIKPLTRLLLSTTGGLWKTSSWGHLHAIHGHNSHNNNQLYVPSEPYLRPWHSRNQGAWTWLRFTFHLRTQAMLVTRGARAKIATCSTSFC